MLEKTIDISGKYKFVGKDLQHRFETGEVYNLTVFRLGSVDTVKRTDSGNREVVIEEPHFVSYLNLDTFGKSWQRVSD